MSKAVCTPYGEAAFPRIAEWRLGDDALIQCVTFDGGGEEVSTEFMSGADADLLLAQILDLGYGNEPISDERGIYGQRYAADNSRIEFWDCDEQTWSEYEREELA